MAGSPHYVAPRLSAGNLNNSEPVSDKAEVGGIYRGYHGSLCVVIGFATDGRNGEQVIAFLSLKDQKHYVTPENRWYLEPKNAPGYKRFARVTHDTLIDALDHRLEK